MDRSAVVGVAIYAALVLSLATPLYLPLGSGRDDSWALLVLLLAAHLGLGAAVRRRWALALPVAVSITAFVAAGADDLAWVAILVGAPALVAFTAAGSAIGRAVRPQTGAIAVGFFAVAVVPAAWAAVETMRRGPPLPASVQRLLPTEISLGNLCAGAETAVTVEQDVRQRADVLLRELRRRPNHLVTFTYHAAHGGEDEHRDITVRELAEEQLKDLKSNGPNCEPDLERRLRSAM
jgi:hypothetical protein